MSAQIAPTPIVHGPEAEKIYEKANREPSEESRTMQRNWQAFLTR